MGDAFLRLHDYERALVEYERALALGGEKHEEVYLQLATAFTVKTFWASAQYTLAVRALDLTSRGDRLLEIALEAHSSGNFKAALEGWRLCKSRGLSLPRKEILSLSAYGRYAGDTRILERCSELLDEEILDADYAACGDALAQALREGNTTIWDSDILYRALDAYARANATEKILALLDFVHSRCAIKHAPVNRELVKGAAAVIARILRPLPIMRLSALADLFLSKETPEDEELGRDLYLLIAQDQHRDGYLT